MALAYRPTGNPEGPFVLPRDALNSLIKMAMNVPPLKAKRFSILVRMGVSLRRFFLNMDLSNKLKNGYNCCDECKNGTSVLRRAARLLAGLSQGRVAEILEELNREQRRENKRSAGVAR